MSGNDFFVEPGEMNRLSGTDGVMAMLGAEGGDVNPECWCLSFVVARVVLRSSWVKR